MKRVDMEKVYSSAIDDILSELKADGQPEHKMAATVIRGLKKDLIRELIRRTELKFQQKKSRIHPLWINRSKASLLTSVLPHSP